MTKMLISSCRWKTLVPFCLRKKRSVNAFLTLTVNYRKIVQKKRNYGMSSKTTINWLFNVYLISNLMAMWCYTWIAYFIIQKLKQNGKQNETESRMESYSYVNWKSIDKWSFTRLKYVRKISHSNSL